MQTKIISINSSDLTGASNLSASAQKSLAELGDILRRGGLVAFPTETVYGLGANALEGSAVAKIFEAKGRPQDNPLIVHIANQKELEYLVDGDFFRLEENAKQAQTLMESFWPGPLTLILPCNDRVPKQVTAGLQTVAVRMPQHPVALSLIEAAGVPVAAPSANLSGKPSPIAASHVIEDLVGKIDAIIDGGRADIGVESTVLDLTTNPPTLLRPGGITLETLEETLGEIEIDPAIINEGLRDHLTPRSPGMKYTHYSPDAKVIVVEGAPDKIALKINQLALEYGRENQRVGILASEENKHCYMGLNSVEIIAAGSRAKLTTVAAGLYGHLREFDARGVHVILAEGYSDKREGFAIMNRLRKAAGYNIIKA